MWTKYRDKYRKPQHEKPLKKKSAFGFGRISIRKDA